MKMKPHTLNRGEDDDREIIAYVHPASNESIGIVLEHTDKTQWVWVTLINGDRIFGVFPQGEEFELTENDGYYPG